MKLIISPAKKMRMDTDTLPWNSLPHFMDKAESLYSKLQSMSYRELKELWRCSDAITAQNVERLQRLDLHSCLTPAILAYEGIQYQYMAPGVFTQGQYDYVQQHLRILSGLYGVLRPFDGVIPYRLEMQARLRLAEHADLYGFWSDAIARHLYQDTDCIINLASREYSLCVSRYLRPGTRFITCVFGEEQGGRIREKGILCKMARGEMIRYLAETGGDRPEALQEFSRLNYRFSPKFSNDANYVFLLSANSG